MKIPKINEKEAGVGILKRLSCFGIETTCVYRNIVNNKDLINVLNKVFFNVRTYLSQKALNFLFRMFEADDALRPRKFKQWPAGFDKVLALMPKYKRRCQPLVINISFDDVMPRST